MSTLHDLRDTLAREAAGVEDHHQHGRPLAVRERVRLARRRRAGAAAALATVVAVAGVAAVGSLRAPGGVEPAGPVVAGVRVPVEVAVQDFPYRLGRTATIGAGDRLRLGSSGAERAVSLVASDVGAGSVTLFADDEPIARATGSEDLEVPVPVSSDGATLRVRLDGADADARAGVAVYDGTGAPADGVADGGAVFRRSVAGAPLLAADFAPEGSAEVTVTFRGRLSEARFAGYCTATERGLSLNIDVDGDGPITGPCSADDSRDAGSSWSSFESDDPAGEHTVHAYLTRGSHGPAVTSAGAVLGVGVYQEPAASRRVSGMVVDSAREYAGRTWQLVRTIPQPGPVELDVREHDVLLAFVGRGAMLHAAWDGRLLDGRSSYVAAGDGPAQAVAGVLLRGDTYVVRLDAGQGSPVEGALLVYRPL